MSHNVHLSMLEKKFVTKGIMNIPVPFTCSYSFSQKSFSESGKMAFVLTDTAWRASLISLD